MPIEIPNNEYHAISRWRVEATREEIAAITATPEDLMRWWPAAFLESRMTKAGDAAGVGAEFECHVKGWLPYSLNFAGRVTEAVYGRKLRVAVWGDFVGGMNCDIEEDGAFCRIVFDWRVRVEKPLVKRLSFLFKIGFYFNHLWVMTQGLKSIKAELARRRSAKIQVATPGPTFGWLRKWLPR
jgi:hypothetical protein